MGDGLGAGLHVDVPGLVWGGHAPHSEDDFVHEPNVIVAHFADGVEVALLPTPTTRAASDSQRNEVIPTKIELLL